VALKELKPASKKFAKTVVTLYARGMALQDHMVRGWDAAALATLTRWLVLERPACVCLPHVPTGRRKCVRV
jgi:hypothetical protein